MTHFYPVSRTFMLLLSLEAALLSTAQQPLDAATQPKFVNRLPIPSAIDARGGGIFNINISGFDQWLGLTDPATGQPLLTPVWGYNGTYPGPTILAEKNIPISVFWYNQLVNANGDPLPHLLPVDPSIHWALRNVPDWQTAGVPVVTHLHGGHTEAASDGYPDAWFTPGFRLRGPAFIKGEQEPYHYSNDQEAATLWYHDHALGITRLNVYAGLAGFYLLTDQNEKNLQAGGALPAAPFDQGLVIQDRMFDIHGKLLYPAQPEEEGKPEPSVIPEFFGDFILVNGMTWPVLEVEPRQYRFRILNGSDSRFFNLSLPGGISFFQVGSDDGLLYAPVERSRILVAPGERIDVVVDFSRPALWGKTLIMQNDAKTPYPAGDPVNPKTSGNIMAFRVNQPLSTNYPLTQLPVTLRPAITPLQSALPARKLVLFEGEDQFDRLKPMLGTVEQGVMDWDAPVTENPLLNTTEIWEIYNETADAHPIHLHLVKMQLINRQRFNATVNEENGKPGPIRLLGQPKLPAAEEQGWKDTWVTYPGEVTRVIANFDLQGLYVWHCHILSHEDHEMMRPFFVGDMSPLVVQDHPKLSRNYVEKDFGMQAIPNPFTNNFTLYLNVTQPAVVSLSIFNAGGMLVKKLNSHEQVSAGVKRAYVDTHDWPAGMYYCEVIINGNRYTRKLLLQR